MSSRTKATQNSKNNRINLGKNSNTNTIAHEEEPLWEFDDVHDTPTVICEVLSEIILNNCNVSMIAMKDLGDSMDNDKNKSDVVMIVTACLLSRVGMEKEAQDMLSNSNVVNESYKEMGLQNKAIAKMFTNMICALNPEFMKSMEVAVIQGMRTRAKRTRVNHTTSRLNYAMKGLVNTGQLTESDSHLASVNAGMPSTENEVIKALNSLMLSASSRVNFSVDEINSGAHRLQESSVNSLAKSIMSRGRIMEFESAKAADDVLPTDSISVARSDDNLDSRALNRIATKQGTFDDKIEELYSRSPESRRPYMPKRSNTNESRGLGFKEALEEIPREKMVAKLDRIRRLSEEKIRPTLTDSHYGQQASAKSDDDDDSDQSSIL